MNTRVGLWNPTNIINREFREGSTYWYASSKSDVWKRGSMDFGVVSNVFQQEKAIPKNVSGSVKPRETNGCSTVP